MTGGPPQGGPAPHTAPDSPRPHLPAGGGPAPSTTPDAPRPEPPAGGPAPRPAPDAPKPVRDDAVARGRALLIARIVITFYLLALLINLFRPHLQPNEPTLTIFQKSPFARAPEAFSSFDKMLSMPRAVFWAVLAGIVIGVALQVFAAITRPQGRRAAALTWATLVALLGPFGLISLSILVLYPAQSLVCVPSTAFVLVLLHGVQRFARVPLGMLLVAFGWGALIVFGLSRAYGNLLFGALLGYLAKGVGPDVNELMKIQYRMLDLLILDLSLQNTLIVAAGVLLLMLLYRHRVSDAMTGLVLGAAVGLGYNFVESPLLMKVYGMLGAVLGRSGGFEYWIRQSIGLLGGQVTFGALLGAGIGLAFQTRDRRRRRIIVASALAASIAGSAASESLSGWLSHLVHEHMHRGGPFDTLVVSPFLWLLPQAPFAVLVLLLLLGARRARADAARTSVSAEASAGTAITLAEVPFLTDPALRFWTLLSTWRRYGQGTALALHRLQTAQLDLAGWRLGQRRPGAADDPAAHGEGERLRAKVMRLKSGTGTGPGATR